MPIGNITIDWEIRHPITKVAGIGRVRFHVPRVLLANTDNVIYGPGASAWITLDINGRGSVQLPDPHDVGLTPQGWAPIVEVDSDVWKAKYPVAIPTGSAGQTLHLNNLSPVDGPIDGDAFALIGHTHSQYLLKTGGTVTGPISWDGTPTDDDHLAPKSYVDAAIDAASGSAGAGKPTLFNVEAFGAVGDGLTDDYTAIRQAWDAALAHTDEDGKPIGGLVYFPRVAVYRVAATPERLAVTGDGARALFPLPMRSRQIDKIAVGMLGVGEAAVVRTADLGDEDGPGHVYTASILKLDYSTPFAWNADGLPCVIGTPDVDATDAAESNIFSNLHVSLDGLIIRQPDNPSLCAVNLEQASTVRIGQLRVDVASVLDQVPEPTHPTGGALLMPRSNNNVAVSIDRLVTEGHYAGIPLTEHIEITSAIALRCKIGVHTRRPNSHDGHAVSLKVEQCPNWISGWDPSEAGPNGGVVPIHGWSGAIMKIGGEDFAYQGAHPWMYAPVSGAHINDPDGVLGGTIGYAVRVNSEPPEPTGIGIGDGGSSSSFYVRGPSGTTGSPVALYGKSHAAATRIVPPGDVPPVEHRLFAAENGPSTSATDGHQPINLGVQVNVTAAGLATKLWFYRGTTAIAGAITGRLWRKTGPTTGVDLGDVTFVVTGTGWISAEFDDPIAVAPGETYVAVVHFPDEWPFTASYWDSGAGGSGIIAGILRAFSTNDQAGGQGVFSSGAITNYPGTTGNGGNYWVDITIVPA